MEAKEIIKRLKEFYLGKNVKPDIKLIKEIQTDPMVNDWRKVEEYRIRYDNLPEMPGTFIEFGRQLSCEHPMAFLVYKIIIDRCNNGEYVDNKKLFIKDLKEHNLGYLGGMFDLLTHDSNSALVEKDWMEQRIEDLLSK